MIKENIEQSNAYLSDRIDSTCSGVTETTQIESHHTRNRIDGTMAVISKLKEDLESTKEGIAVVSR